MEKPSPIPIPITGLVVSGKCITCTDPGTTTGRFTDAAAFFLGGVGASQGQSIDLPMCPRHRRAHLRREVLFRLGLIASIFIWIPIAGWGSEWMKALEGSVFLVFLAMAIHAFVGLRYGRRLMYRRFEPLWVRAKAERPLELIVTDDSLRVELRRLNGMAPE